MFGIRARIQAAAGGSDPRQAQVAFTREACGLETVFPMEHSAANEPRCACLFDQSENCLPLFRFTRATLPCLWHPAADLV